MRSTVMSAFLVLAASAPAGRADVLIVLNKSDHEAALVDPSSLKVVAKLPTVPAMMRKPKTSGCCDFLRRIGKNCVYESVG